MTVSPNGFHGFVAVTMSLTLLHLFDKAKERGCRGVEDKGGSFLFDRFKERLSHYAQTANNPIVYKPLSLSQQDANSKNSKRHQNKPPNTTTTIDPQAVVPNTAVWAAKKIEQIRDTWNNMGPAERVFVFILLTLLVTFPVIGWVLVRTLPTYFRCKYRLDGTDLETARGHAAGARSAPSNHIPNDKELRQPTMVQRWLSKSSRASDKTLVDGGEVSSDPAAVKTNDDIHLEPLPPRDQPYDYPLHSSNHIPEPSPPASPPSPPPLRSPPQSPVIPTIPDDRERPGSYGGLGPTASQANISKPARAKLRKTTVDTVDELDEVDLTEAKPCL